MQARGRDHVAVGKRLKSAVNNRVPGAENAGHPLRLGGDFVGALRGCGIVGGDGDQGVHRSIESHDDIPLGRGRRDEDGPVRCRRKGAREARAAEPADDISRSKGEDICEECVHRLERQVECLHAVGEDDFVVRSGLFFSDAADQPAVAVVFAIAGNRDGSRLGQRAQECSGPVEHGGSASHHIEDQNAVAHGHDAVGADEPARTLPR